MIEWFEFNQPDPMVMLRRAARVDAVVHAALANVDNGREQLTDALARLCLAQLRELEEFRRLALKASMFATTPTFAEFTAETLNKVAASLGIPGRLLDPQPRLVRPTCPLRSKDIIDDRLVGDVADDEFNPANDPVDSTDVDGKSWRDRPSLL